MLKLIDGKLIAEKVKDEIFHNIFYLSQKLNRRPNLAIILVGDNLESKLYVSLKEKEAKKVGIDVHIYYLEEDVVEKELIETIGFLNQDPIIDGILLQLPLPRQLNVNKIIKLINPSKDVDGFHPSRPNFIISPVISAVAASLDFVNQKELYTVSIFGKSEIFINELEQFFIKNNYQILTTNQSHKADIIVTALGQASSIKAKHIKKGAVLIDIGISKRGKKIFGDIDFNSVKDKAAYLTPVPGGIGPMTIAFLFKNTWEIFCRKTK